MPGFPKIYTTAGTPPTNEVAHTAQNATTISGAMLAGNAQLTLASATGWPTSGYLDITDGVNGNETIGFYGLSGSVIQLAKPLAFNHPSGCTINWWYYSLAIGDQTSGIPNDGTNAAPNSPTNVSTWYVYNPGDQVAQAVTLSTSSGAPSTPQGFADTLISLTSASSGFATSQTVGNLPAASGSGVQFWLVEEIPNGQSAAGNPQVCVINIAFSTV